MQQKWDRHTGIGKEMKGKMLHIGQSLSRQEDGSVLCFLKFYIG